MKNFAMNARKELIEKVKAKAFRIGITEESIKKAQFESSDSIFIDGKPLDAIEKWQREKLISRIKELGYKQVVEEVAYTWFNRFTALRFMEVNNYLPTKVRVLSSSNSDSSEPDLIKEALTVDLDIDKELVYDLKLNNKTDQLFKYLVIKQCNSLNEVLPFMFETIDDYKEILFPEGLLSKDSFINEMVNITNIPESDWEQVEIIGWLYQFYISEKKDHVFADLKKNIKISKENIPAATQLFTPHWIVKYMVENSLGRIWIENNPNSPLKSDWKYYLEQEQEGDSQKEFDEIRYKNVNPEDITFLDPCCGSGHILTYAFDVLYAMYLEKGYIDHEIPKLILEKNLFGLDIDDRAAQLASFAVMMKAREKSRRVFGQDIKLNICAIQESNWMTDEIIDTIVDKEASELEGVTQRQTLEYIRNTFNDAKEYGSILDVEHFNIDYLEKRLEGFSNDTEDQGNITDRIVKAEILEKMPEIVLQTKIMGIKYDVVCTNPPYMGGSGIGEKLSNYIKRNYINSKSDLFAVFIERCLEYTKASGFIAMITMHSWMFLSSFEELRKYILSKKNVNMIHIGYNSFPELNSKVAQATAFIVRNDDNIKRYNTKYLDLTNKYPQAFDKEVAFFIEKEKGYYIKQFEDFSKLPGMPIAYWVSEKVSDLFVNNERLGSFADPRQGLATGNDNFFLRSWHEVYYPHLGIGYKDKESLWNDSKKYAPFNKGGAFRRWYGNNEIIIKFDEENYNKLLNSGNHLPSRSFYFKEGVTWTALTSNDFSGRYCGDGYVFAGKGPMCFPRNQRDIYYLTGLLNSKLTNFFMEIFSMTMDFTQGTLRNVPIVKMPDTIPVDDLVKKNIDLSQSDWDSFESSWDFRQHPLLKYKAITIETAFNSWASETYIRFSQMKENEEELNQIFINHYGLQEELSPEVEKKNVTIRTADCERDIKSFLSYAIGCMFGRYSLDKEGLIFAGGNIDLSQYQTLQVDKDNVLPVVNGAYFEDDIVSQIIEFVKITFGEDSLSINLEFIAEALGKKDGETAKESIRKYFLNDFFKDHVQTFKKKPIYWLFTSGKQKAFNCLIYMHRYDKSTLSRIRTDYLHELQIRMDAQKKSLIDIINGDGTTKEISNAKNELKSLDLKIEELRAYDEQLHHMADMQIEIDLDDGVVVNYAKFEGLLAPIK